MYAQEDANKDFGIESEQYQRGYLHAMDDVQRKIQLRNIYVTVNKGRLNPNQPSKCQQNIDKKKEKQKEQIVYKEPVNKVERTSEFKQPTLIDVEKIVSTFNLQIDISKVKISIPLNELLRSREYRDKITNMVMN